MPNLIQLIATGVVVIPTIRKDASGTVGKDGRQFQLYDAPLIPAQRLLATGTGNYLELGDLRSLDLRLDIFFVSGTLPTLDVIVETSRDGTNDWRTAGVFARKTAVSYELNVFTNLSRWARASWIIGGSATPTFDMSLTGEAK